MTESEAKGFIQGKLDCMKKCGVFNKEDNINYNDCDYCNYCYSQGNFGQQKEAFNMAINALEKQIPKKPTPIDYKKYMDVVNNAISLKGGFWCPNCKCVVKSGTYCNLCGQRLDWSDEE